MKMSFIRRIFISLLTTAVFSSAALSQAKETPSQEKFAKLDAMRVHYQNYGEGADDRLHSAKHEGQKEP
jgi:hypothetical protein